MPSTIENLEVSPSAGRVLREILITNVRSFVFRRAGYSCVSKPQMDSWDGEREHLRAIPKQSKAHTKICARSSLVQTRTISRTSGKLHIVPDFTEVVLSLWRVGPCCTRHETSVYHTPQSALSGLNIALWDIKGKRLGVPIWQLLGGKVRDKVKVYGWVGGDKPSDVISAAKRRKDQGFLAVKMNGTGELHYLSIDH